MHDQPIVGARNPRPAAAARDLHVDGVAAPGMDARSAAIVEAGKKFRRVQGWRDIAKLVTALKELEAKDEAAAERVA